MVVILINLIEASAVDAHGPSNRSPLFIKKLNKWIDQYLSPSPLNAKLKYIDLFYTPKTDLYRCELLLNILHPEHLVIPYAACELRLVCIETNPGEFHSYSGTLQLRNKDGIEFYLMKKFSDWWFWNHENRSEPLIFKKWCAFALRHKYSDPFTTFNEIMLNTSKLPKGMNIHHLFVEITKFIIKNNYASYKFLQLMYDVETNPGETVKTGIDDIPLECLIKVHQYLKNVDIKPSITPEVLSVCLPHMRKAYPDIPDRDLNYLLYTTHYPDLYFSDTDFNNCAKAFNIPVITLIPYTRKQIQYIIQFKSFLKHVFKFVLRFVMNFISAFLLPLHLVGTFVFIGIVANYYPHFMARYLFSRIISLLICLEIIRNFFIIEFEVNQDTFIVTFAMMSIDYTLDLIQWIKNSAFYARLMLIFDIEVNPGWKSSNHKTPQEKPKFKPRRKFTPFARLRTAGQSRKYKRPTLKLYRTLNYDTGCYEIAKERVNTLFRKFLPHSRGLERLSVTQLKFFQDCYNANYNYNRALTKVKHIPLLDGSIDSLNQLAHNSQVCNNVHLMQLHGSAPTKPSRNLKDILKSLSHFFMRDVDYMSLGSNHSSNSISEEWPELTDSVYFKIHLRKIRQFDKFYLKSIQYTGNLVVLKDLYNDFYQFKQKLKIVLRHFMCEWICKIKHPSTFLFTDPRYSRFRAYTNPVGTKYNSKTYKRLLNYLRRLDKSLNKTIPGFGHYFIPGDNRYNTSQKYFNPEVGDDDFRPPSEPWFKIPVGITGESKLFMIEALKFVNANFGKDHFNPTVNVRSPMFESFTEKLGNFTETQVYKITCMFFITGLSYMSYEYDLGFPGKALIFALQSLLSFTLPDDPILETVQTIVKTIPFIIHKKEKYYNPEVGENTNDTIASAILSYVYVSAFGKCDRSSLMNFVDSFIKNTKDVSRIKNSTDVTVEHFSKLIGNFCNYLASNTGLEFLRSVHNPYPEISNLYNDFNKIVDGVSAKKAYDRDDYDLLNIITNKLRHLKSSIVVTRHTADQHKALDNLSNMIRLFESKFVGMSFDNRGLRCAPSGIFFYGGPGVGKSLIMIFVMHAIAAEVMPLKRFQQYKKNYKDEVYNWVMESKFQTGYRGQWFVTLDDGFQLTKHCLEGWETAFAILRMINNNEYVTEQAHLDLKGVDGFCSNCIIGTANELYPEFPEIAYMNAVFRRLLEIIMTVKIQYARDSEVNGDVLLRKLDITKLPNYDADCPENTKVYFDAWEFFLFDRSEKRYHTPMDFHQMIKYCANYVKSNLARQRALIECSQGFLDELYHLKLEIEHDVIADEEVIEEMTDITLTPNQNNIVRLMAVENNISFPAAVQVYKKINFEELSINDFNNVFYAHVCTEVKTQFALHFKTFSEFIKNNGILIAIGSAAAVGCYLWMNVSHEYSPESGKTRSRVAPKAAAKSLKVINKSAIKFFNPESGHYTENTCDMICSILKYNAFQVYITDSTGTLLKPNSIFTMIICDRIGLAYRHFFDYLSDLHSGWMDSEGNVTPPVIDLTIKLVSYKSIQYNILFTDLREHFFYFDGSENDRGFFYFHPSFNIPPRRNIMKYFAKQDDMLFTQTFTAGMLMIRDEADPFPMGEVVPNGPVHVGHYPMAFGWEQKFCSTRAGDCGSVYITADSKLKPDIPLIFATHVGGLNGKIGVMMSITREEIAIAIDAMGTNNLQLVDVSTVIEYPTDVIPPHLDIEAIVKSANIPPPGDYIPTKFFDKFEYKNSKLPAIVTKDNLTRSRAKYSPVDMPALDIKMLNDARRAFTSFLAQRLDFTDYVEGPVTYQAAVEGDGAPGINRHSDPGHPHNLSFRKIELWGSEGPYEFTSKWSKHIENLISENNDNILKGIPLQPIARDLSKADETLPIEKAEAGKLRLMCSYPVDYVAGGRMQFLNVLKLFMKNPIVSGIALGVNPNSPHWGRIVDELFHISRYIIATDQKHFDACNRASLIWQSNELLEELCFPNSNVRDRTLRYGYIEPFMHSWHMASEQVTVTQEIIDLFTEAKFHELYPKKKIGDRIVVGWVYQWLMSLSSGHWFTFLFNSIIHQIEIRYAAALILLDGRTYESGLIDWNWINDNSCHIVAGDDYIGTVSQAMIDLGVNQKTLIEAFAKMGRTVTNDDKSSTVYLHRELADVGFLQRTFRWEAKLGQWLAPLNKRSIFGSLYWTHSKGREEDFLQVIRVACGELANYGEDSWMIDVPPIHLAAWNLYGYYVPERDWRSAIAFILSHEAYHF